MIMRSKETVTTRRAEGLNAFTDKQWLKKRKKERNARRQRKVTRKNN